MQSTRTFSNIASPSAERDSKLFGSYTTADAVVVSSILLIGAGYFLLCARAPDFLHDDVFYADAARSLLRKGLYGIEGRPETNQPPGLSLLLASVFAFFGFGHLASLRTMAVCVPLGLVAAYELLRREAPRLVAAAICVLLACSMFWLGLATNWVVPSFPFLITTMLALLALRRLEAAARPGPRAGWAAVSSALTAASILFASAGIALIGAMLARTAVLFRRDWRQAFARLQAFAPVLLVGLAVQYAWMARRSPPLEWPEVAGYPGSYLSQLALKSGHQPELGLVTATDIPVRMVRNLFARSKMLTEFLVGHSMRDLWVSSVILGVLLLVLIGWVHSLWKSGGGALHDWYFAGHELIYLLWPWNTEPRFLVAVAPLACLYLWRGMQAVAELSNHHARALGLVWSSASIAGLLLSTQMSLRGPTGGLVHGVTSLVFWILSGAVAGWMAWTGDPPLRAGSRWRALLVRQGIAPGFALRCIGGIAIGCLLLANLRQDVTIARGNLHPSDLPPPDVEAARWIRSHTDPGAVVMARHVPIAHYVSQRRVVWFPPWSEPLALMRGIRRHGVSWVMLGDSGGDDYYLPTDYACFAPLLAAFPASFHLAFHNPRVDIYQVAEGSAAVDASDGGRSR